MTDRKLEPVRRDDECWAELKTLVRSLDPEQVVREGYNEAWSVKDLLAHLGCWYAEGSKALTQMRMDTYRKRDLGVDAMNAEWYDVWRDRDLVMVRSEINAARWRFLEEWSRIVELTDAAEEWFRDTSYGHYEEHLPRLRAWVAELVPAARG